MKIDWLCLALVFVLTCIGISLVYSATVNSEPIWHTSRWFRQIIYFFGGCALATLFAVVRIDYWQRLAFPLYFLTIAALAFVALGGGDAAKGAGRWIDFGFIKILLRLCTNALLKVLYLGIIKLLLLFLHLQALSRVIDKGCKRTFFRNAERLFCTE